MTSFAALGTAVIGLGVLLLLFFLPRLVRRSHHGWQVLLVGPSGGGKTTLFLRLLGKARKTVTSMSPNRGTVSSGGTNTTVIVDLPGHPRLESTYFEGEVGRCKGVIVVVDAVNFNASKDEFARRMYRLLTSPVIRGRGVPMLVACNKSDCGAKAHTCEFIRKRTEKLVQQLYEADVGDSMRVDAEAREHHILSHVDGAFTFEQLNVKRRFHRPLRVEFASISASTGDVAPVNEFLDGL